MTDGKGYRFKSGWLSQHWLRMRVAISRIDSLGSKRTCRPLGVSSLGNLIDEFVRSSILLKSAEPEGVALARPPENIFVKEIIEIVVALLCNERDAIADVLLRRDQAAQKHWRDHAEVLGPRKFRNNPSVSLRRIGYYYGDRNKTAEAAQWGIDLMLKCQS